MWSITGIAGIGKTRLMTELTRTAAQGGFEVRWSLSTWEGQTPLFPFLGLFRAQSENAVPWAAIRTPQCGPLVVEVDEPRRRRKARRPGRTPDHIALDLLDSFDEAARLAPQLVVIDDFHRSDPDSVRFLGLLARHLSNRRIMVVFSFREESPFSRDSVPSRLAELLEELRIAGLVQTIELSGLPEDEAVHLAKIVLRAASPKARWDSYSLSALVRTAGGNPFFLRELVARLIDARGAPRRTTPSTTSVKPSEDTPEAAFLSGSLQDLLCQRLAALPPVYRRVLGTAAIAGDSFSGEEVAACLGRGQATTHQRLRRMAAGGWPIRRPHRSEDRYTFGHALLRQASVGLLLPSERRQIAGRLAVWYARHHPEDLESVARFYAESGRPSGGLRAVDHLIEEALEVHAFASLERYFLWKSRMVGSSERARRHYRISFFAVLERVRPYLPSDFGGLCQSFLTLHPPEPQRSVAEAWSADAMLTEDVTGAGRLLEGLRRRVSSMSGSDGFKAQVHVELTEIRYWLFQGKIDRALPRARRLYRRVRSMGPSIELLAAVYAIANCLQHLDRFPEAMNWVRRGHGIARQAGLTQTTAGLGLLYLEAFTEDCTGSSSRAADLFESLAQGYSDVGSFWGAATAWANAGASRLRCGDLVGARQSYADALRLARKCGFSAVEGISYVGLGHAFLVEGRLAEATREFRRALPLLWRVAAGETFEILARTGLACVHIERGEMAEADGQLKIAERMCRGNLKVTIREVERARAQWLARGHDVRAARQLLHRALARNFRGYPRLQRLETLAALARLESFAGRPRTARRLEAEVRAEGALAGADVNSPVYLGNPSVSWASPPLPNSSLDTGLKDSGQGSPAGCPQSAAGRVLSTLSRVGAISGAPLDTDEVSPAFTQAGLAAEMGIPRGSFVRTLLRLVDRGAVVQVRRRVQGSARSQKAYLLTPEGAEMARALTP
jgi:tetratricopeptide (TPR) repeat protein